MAFQTTIVGLGLLGSSIGLALRGTAASIEIVGHDKDSGAAKRAYKDGCVDRTEWNLINACDGADLVVISTALAEIKSTLAAIGLHLKEGCVVTDTASLKVPVLGWARQSLPATVHFVGGHPIIDKPVPDRLTPAADLLTGAVYCLIPDTDTPPEALQAASDLAEAVGARTYYLDAAEHDGLIAAVGQVPLLLALALQAMAAANPSRREMIYLSGVDFASVTQLLTGDAETLTEMCRLNAPNVTRWLDTVLSHLSYLRELLTKQDVEALQRAFAAAIEARENWLPEPVEGEVVDYSDFGTLRTMFGGSFRPHRRPNE